MSVVYYIRCENSGLIKIGLSTDVNARLSQLQVSSAAPLILLATEQGGSATEKARHGQFAAAHFRGEWFSPTTDLLAHIAGLAPAMPKAPRVRASMAGTARSDAEFAEIMGCSRAYPTQMRLGMKPVTLDVALTFFAHTGDRIGPLARATETEIATLSKFVLAPAHFESRTLPSERALPSAQCAPGPDGYAPPSVRTIPTHHGARR